jgi:integrase
MSFFEPAGAPVPGGSRSGRVRWREAVLPIHAPGPGRSAAGLRRSTFRRTWTKARNAVGLPHLHFHDLRHTGNNMAAGQGASLRELMERMGHSSTRAALIYQHATRERDQAFAAGTGKLPPASAFRACLSTLAGPCPMPDEGQ